MTRKKVTLTIDSGALAWAKAVGVNMSRLLDEALLNHKERMERNWGSDCQKIDGPGRIRTGGLRRVRADSDLGHSRASDLQAVYAQHRMEFVPWITKKVSEKSAQAYISAVDRYLTGERPIRKPKDLNAHGDKQTRGLRNFYNFCEDYLEIDALLNEPLAKWRKHTQIRASGVVEIYPSDREIAEAYAAVPDEHKPLYLALVYSGNRLSQVLDTLRSFSPKDVTYDGDVAHISAAAQSRGTKQSYRLFFPASFIPTLIAYAKSPASKQAYGTIQKRLAHGRVSARTIRKWHLNFMIEHGVTESIADFIQGRTPATVGSAHYLNKVKGAVTALAHIPYPALDHNLAIIMDDHDSSHVLA